MAHSTPPRYVDPVASSSEGAGSSTLPQSDEPLLDDTIQSTPPNRGTACMAEYQNVGIIDALKSGILEDIKTTKECELESMFCALLRIISQRTDDSLENKRWAEERLDQCLEGATMFVNDKKNVHAQSLRSGLEKYCGGTSEIERYPGTVEALNAILCHFRSANQQDLPVDLQVPNRDELKALFRINDPSVIKPFRATASNSRKPDIVQLDWETSKMLNGDEFVYDSFEATILAANNNVRPPPNEERQLRWDEVFSDVELKKKDLLKDRIIPLTYDKHHLKYQDTLTPLKPSRSGFDDDLHSTSASRTSTPKKSSTPTKSRFGSRSTHDIQLEPPAPTRQTRSSAAAGSSKSASSFNVKRVSDPFTSGGSYKSARKTSRLHPVTQSAMYAAERLSTGAWVKCAISVILSDDELYLTIYDRQSPLAARGFDIIDHLPHFVVLVFILQRLQHCQWHTFTSLSPHDTTSGFQIKNHMATIWIENREFTFDVSDANTFFVLNGRGTTGVPVVAAGTQDGSRLFLKMSWPQRIRHREDRIIERIRRLNEEYPTIADHTPSLLAFQACTTYSTSQIRTLLGFGSTEDSQILCCGVYETLQPITNLKGLDFWKAYWEIIYTHRLLWQKGIEHGDISINNMMCRVKDGVYKGVLNDFDFARLTVDGKREGDQGTDRTGTLPFMAIDLLSPEACKGKVRHLYRHDLESFMWVLCWVISCYEKGEELRPLPEPFAGWTMSISQTYKEKKSFLLEFSAKPLQSWLSLSNAAWLMSVFWQSFYAEKFAALRIRAFAQDKTPFPEEKDAELFQNLLSFLKKGKGALQLSDDVLAVLPLNFDSDASTLPTNPPPGTATPQIAKKRRRDDEDDEDELLERLVKSKKPNLASSTQG